MNCSACENKHMCLADVIEINMTSCFVCCKSGGGAALINYVSSHALKYTKMPLMTCIKDALQDCTFNERSDLTHLRLCRKCDQLIFNLDHLCHQYNETQENLRSIYKEAHTQFQEKRDALACQNSEERADENLDDDETRFLQRLNKRTRSRRIIKRNPRYTDYSLSDMKPVVKSSDFLRERKPVQDCIKSIENQTSLKRTQKNVEGPTPTNTSDEFDGNSIKSEGVSLVTEMDASSSPFANIQNSSKYVAKDKTDEKVDQVDGDPCSKLSSFKEKNSKKRCEKKYMQEEKCSLCGEVVIGRMGLKRHKLIHSRSQEQKVCGVCGRVLHNATAYKVHMQRLHGQALQDAHASGNSSEHLKKKMTCEICGKTYHTMSGLSYHLAAKHNQGPRFQCEKCDKVFPHSRNLSSHMAQFHGSFSMICEYCGMTFKLQTQLNSHINSVHLGVTSWGCNLCTAKFSSHVDYRIHINKHKGLTYACDICDKQYSWPEALKKHKKMKHEGNHGLKNSNFRKLSMKSGFGTSSQHPAIESNDGRLHESQNVITPYVKREPTEIFALEETEGGASKRVVEVLDTNSANAKFVKMSLVCEGSHIAPNIIQNTATDTSDILGVSMEVNPLLPSVVSVVNQKVKADSLTLDTASKLDVSCKSVDLHGQEIITSRPLAKQLTLKSREAGKAAVKVKPLYPLIAPNKTSANDSDKKFQRVLTAINPKKEEEPEEGCQDSQNESLLENPSSAEVFSPADVEELSSGQVEEVMIVETDASVSYDYIVYHVSDPQI